YGEHNSDQESECIHYDPPPLTLTNVSGGTGPLSYQWQFSSDGNNWSNIPGANGTSYDPSDDMTVLGQFYYRAVISDVCGFYETSPKHISIVSDPTVTALWSASTF